MNKQEPEIDIWGKIFIGMICLPFIAALLIQAVPIILLVLMFALLIAIVFVLGVLLQGAFYGSIFLFDKYCFKGSGYGILVFFIFFLLVIPLYSIAHSGRTDSSGGHYNRSTGDYHFHGGSVNAPAPAPRAVSNDQGIKTLMASLKPGNAEENTNLPQTEELQGILYNGKTYVPLRPICEALDVTMQWFPWEKATIITLSNQKAFKVTTINRINP